MTHNFEVGDKVVDNKGTLWEVFETETSDPTYHCASTEDGTIRWCWFTKTGKADSSVYNDRELVGFAETDKVVEQPVTNKAHKHKYLIIAWANGAEIEFFDDLSRRWYYTDRPVWGSHTQYRIKPEQKPDVVKYVFVEAKPSFCNITNDNNLKLTFCGETGKLKAAEVVN